MRANRARVLLLLAILGCSRPEPAPDPGYAREIDAYRKEREDRLRSDSGWLTLVGLHRLTEGDNTFGSDPAGPIVLPDPAVPPRAGTLRRQGDVVRVVADPSAEITQGGRPVVEQVLRDDRDGQPDVLQLGRLSLTLIHRDGMLALRVRDPLAPTRTAFRGLDYYPVDPAYRVEATLDRHAAPRTVTVPTVLGTTTSMTSPGRLRFVLKGKELSLEPLLESAASTEFFLIFKDETSGVETYPAARYLYAASSPDGRSVLDFNRAYNPPCAFTPYATCPLPPPGNVLPVAIRAGEKAYHGPPSNLQ